jgi:hypothetical protein
MLAQNESVECEVQPVRGPLARLRLSACREQRLDHFYGMIAACFFDTLSSTFPRALLHQAPRMKPISASIIVLAAAILLVGGSHVQHGDTKLFVQVVGCGVGLAGLWGWFVSFKEK